MRGLLLSLLLATCALALQAELVVAAVEESNVGTPFSPPAAASSAEEVSPVSRSVDVVLGVARFSIF